MCIAQSRTLQVQKAQQQNMDTAITRDLQERKSEIPEIAGCSLVSATAAPEVAGASQKAVAWENQMVSEVAVRCRLRRPVPGPRACADTG